MANNIFYTLKGYALPWIVSSERNFSEEEVNSVAKAVVTPSNHGTSVCFFMKSGGMTYIPCSRDSEAAVGEEINLSKASLLTLSKQGESDIVRIKC